METLVNELHRGVREVKKFRKVITHYPNEIWGIDLVDMQVYKDLNDGYGYIMNIIDIYSRKAWAFPIKTKHAVSTLAVYQEMVRLYGPPTHVWVDRGKEFYDTEWIKEKVPLYSTNSDEGCSYVERFNKTLKGIMWKQFQLQGSYKWLGILDSLIDKYNNRVHSSTGLKPNEVYVGGVKIKRPVEFSKVVKPRYKIGDKVRISTNKHIFEKKYTPNWSFEVYTVDKISNIAPILYYLKDFMGEKIDGGFYESQLQLTTVPDLFLIDKVVAVRGNKALVKWRGHDDKFNSWVDKRTIEIIGK